MSLSFTYPRGVGSFPRSYIKGFVGLLSYTMPPISGNELHLIRVSDSQDFVFWITDRFLAPTSNVYSLDFVFDPSRSHFYFHGVDTPNSLTITLTTDPIDFSFRIAIQQGVNTDFSAIADLQPVSPYWRHL